MNPFYAPYFEPYAYAEPYPWVAGTEFAYESDEMVGFDPIWLTYPTFVGPPLIAAKKLGLFDGDDESASQPASRTPSSESRRSPSVQPSGGGGGASSSSDDSWDDRPHRGRHRHKKTETDWTTYAWIGAGVLGAGLVIALIIPRGGK
jgi:hypothetical protein